MVQADFLSCIRAIYNNIFTLAVTEFEFCSDIWKCIDTYATVTFIDNSTKARRQGEALWHLQQHTRTRISTL
jgi:hypothetical protein